MEKLTKEQIEQFIDEREIEGFEIIQDTLVNDYIDDGDFNPHVVIIKSIEGKFYNFGYDQWIGAELKEDDIDSDLIEVEPVEKTIIIYQIKL